mmetsp:Transcript_50899/g.143277  ORF Transcript_50899/g.143277 Transcript_50899/m.143277 type:complete len:215 (+) Transcript_50899:316-960(+)
MSSSYASTSSSTSTAQPSPHVMKLYHCHLFRRGAQALLCASVHSITSAITQEVSSILPPLPIGASGSRPQGPGRVFAWHASTMRLARWPRKLWWVGTALPGGRTALHRSATSSRNKLSNTPSLPITMMSPSYADTQCTALPFSITSIVIPSWKSGSIRSSTRASCRGVWKCPSIRCISVWKTACSALFLPCRRRSMRSSQSPIEITAIIGCSLP